MLCCYFKNVRSLEVDIPLFRIPTVKDLTGDHSRIIRDCSEFSQFATNQKP